VEDALIKSGQFRLPGKRQLVRGFGKPIVVVLDVTETPIERPQPPTLLLLCARAAYTSMPTGD